MGYCKDCRFWDVQKDEYGQCRAHPPTNRPKPTARWPKTASDMWCGEFEPKTQSIRAVVISYRFVIEGRESPWIDSHTHEWVGNDLVLQAIKDMKPQTYRDKDKNIQVQTQYITEAENCLVWRIRMVEVKT